MTIRATDTHCTCLHLHRNAHPLNICSTPQAELAYVKDYNFDHPDAFDTPALLECLDGLKAGRSVEVPTYDFSRHRRGEETKKVGAHGCSRGHGMPASIIRRAAQGWLVLACVSCA